ncbi:MAG: redoxin domain-containing protein [Bacteroidales bacterium]|nr:redoxin domain-containing protein [Bacteroidales bacterium]
MKLRILLAFVILVAASFGLNAQTPEEVDLDLKYAADMLKSGTAAPDFMLNDVNGKTVSLSDFKGKKVVLEFWASWCPDYRAELLMQTSLLKR